MGMVTPIAVQTSFEGEPTNGPAGLWLQMFVVSFHACGVASALVTIRYRMARFVVLPVAILVGLPALALSQRGVPLLIEAVDSDAGGRGAGGQVVVTLAVLTLWVGIVIEVVDGWCGGGPVGPRRRRLPEPPRSAPARTSREPGRFVPAVPAEQNRRP